MRMCVHIHVHVHAYEYLLSHWLHVCCVYTYVVYCRIFVSLEKLKVLRASQNQLTVLPHEIGVLEVQELDLHCNKLVALPQWLLVKLSQ